jgi:hypothetical protein
MTMIRFATVGVTALALAVGLGCDGAGPDVLTYEEFAARAYVEPDTGLAVLNGDELVETEGAMRDLYAGYLASAAAAADREAGLATAEQGLIVNRVGGVDDRWSATQARNLTYCVSRTSFGTRYNAVVSAMASAAGAWEAASTGINFVHSSTLDSNCSRSTTGVVFNVRLVSTTQYLARAFFPSTSRSGREILISTSSFGNVSPYTLTGILRHELGHTLGFRHEHTRPETGGVCFEDNQWRALTTYDSASVMHYPQCRGTQTGDLVLTTRDRQGADALY